MNKIRLELDELAVESFPTSDKDSEPRGTVHGHIPPETYARYCSDGITCFESCDFCISDDTAC